MIKIKLSVIQYTIHIDYSHKIEWYFHKTLSVYNDAIWTGPNIKSNQLNIWYFMRVF